MLLPRQPENGRNRFGMELLVCFVLPIRIFRTSSHVGSAAVDGGMRLDARLIFLLPSSVIAGRRAGSQLPSAALCLESRKSKSPGLPGGHFTWESGSLCA